MPLIQTSSSCIRAALISPTASKDMPLLAHRPGWRDLKAVREARVVVTDGNHYFNRSGPRIVESLEILAEILHPELFAARYEDSVRVFAPM